MQVRPCQCRAAGGLPFGVSKQILLRRARRDLLAEGSNVDRHVDPDNWAGTLKNADVRRPVEVDGARPVPPGLRGSF